MFKKDGVRKNSDQRPVKSPANRSEPIWLPGNGGKSDFQLVQESKSEAGFTLFIPYECFIDFDSGLRLNDDVSHGV